MPIIPFTLSTIFIGMLICCIRDSKSKINHNSHRLCNSKCRSIVYAHTGAALINHSLNKKATSLASSFNFYFCDKVFFISHLINLDYVARFIESTRWKTTDTVKSASTFISKFKKNGKGSFPTTLQSRRLRFYHCQLSIPT